MTTPTRPKPLAETLTGAAKLEYEAGGILFRDGDFATAIQKFRAAYAAQPDPRLLWNIAACEKNLRHYTKAVVLVRKYIADGSSLLSPEEVEEANHVLGVIEKLTVAVTITVSEPGAEVWLDDERLGLSPLQNPIVADLGHHKVRVQKEGFRAVVREEQLGSTTTIDVTLQKQNGRLELTVAQGAAVFLDDREIGIGPLLRVDNLPVGPHTLRITAPKMRSYQGELVLEDDKLRQLTINLEPDPEQFGEVRVAVGCRDERIRTPEDGLTVFFDDGSESASPLGVRKRIDAGREVPAYVPFTVGAGAHRMRVRFPGCDSLELAVNAGPGKPTEVRGILPPLNPFLNGSPAGSPNGWRVHAGFATSNITFPKFQKFFANPTLGDVSADLSLAGLSAGAGLHVRWFTLVGEVRYLVGSSTGTRPGVSFDSGGPTGTLAPVSQEGSFSLKEAGLRFGPRVPLWAAAISGGFGLSGGALSASPANGTQSTNGFGRATLWAAIEAQPICDWALHGGFTYSAVGIDSDAAGRALLDRGIFMQLAYAPNVVCERRHAGLYALRAE